MEKTSLIGYLERISEISPHQSLLCMQTTLPADSCEILLSFLEHFLHPALEYSIHSTTKTVALKVVRNIVLVV